MPDIAERAAAEGRGRRWIDLLLILGIGLAYFVLAKAGLTLASINPSATPVWPPTGLAIAALLLLGWHAAPAVFLGAAIANLSTTGDLPSSLAIALGNTLEGAVGALLTQRWAGGVRAFETPARVLRFVGICLIIATPISATIGVASLSASGLAESAVLPAVWTTWWLGDFTGALIVAPAIVLWTRNWPLLADREQALIFAAAGAIGLIAFSPLLEQTAIRSALAFLAVLPLLWAALRTSPRETATVALIIAGCAVWGTNAGGGPFARERPDESFLLLLMFVISICLPSLVLAANQAVHRAVLAQKEMLLREVHHRVKNNLQVISSMIALRSRQAAKDSQPHFEALAERVQALGRIYEQIHNAGDLTEIDIGQCLRDIAGSVRTDRIAVETAAPELRIGVDTAIPLALIALELSANAVKHAFPSGSGVITVDLRKLDGRRAELIVADDGIGFTPGAVAPNATGLRIVQALVRQLDGEIETRSRPGTVHRLVFPA